MKITFNCVENGGFSGKYDLPGFGCVVYVNADNNIVTIDIVDENEEQIKTDIQEERAERIANGDTNFADYEFEILSDWGNDDDQVDDDELDECIEDGLDELGDFDEDEVYEEDEDEVNEEDEDIESSFEYAFIKSVQKADPSGIVVSFIEKMLDELDIRDQNGAYNEKFYNLVKNIADYISDNKV